MGILKNSVAALAIVGTGYAVLPALAHRTSNYLAFSASSEGDIFFPTINPITIQYKEIDKKTTIQCSPGFADFEAGVLGEHRRAFSVVVQLKDKTLIAYSMTKTISGIGADDEEKLYVATLTGDEKNGSVEAFRSDNDAGANSFGFYERKDSSLYHVAIKNGQPTTIYAGGKHEFSGALAGHKPEASSEYKAYTIPNKDELNQALEAGHKTCMNNDFRGAAKAAHATVIDSWAVPYRGIEIEQAFHAIGTNFVPEQLYQIAFTPL